ncbi:hypothetical protein DICPUDRAFT_74997 [Dictyostelium purpureum]|uniref:Transmembrane protein n=1 Tax=Dictyostelium purpureum TaxID=5786 RepID=F0Z9C3_DICPU|nr:uncharacterized protein DICPUDRAFT_74997 [Dictyostelium purpureum]EGC39476.1 hypothetical protein DICPUDRAFT_74997 [Dictyostelium purpureum]|eukprot:XP_003284034.1 hypothetical protein DICPUDRAFT_74997 [Dictyostelium purpureum]
MKKIIIQKEYNKNEKEEFDNNFSVLKQNKILTKNESNKNKLSCISCFSGLKFGLFLYTFLLATFTIGIIGAVGISDHNVFEDRNFVKYPLMVGLGFGLFFLFFCLSFIRILSSPITTSLKDFRRGTNQPLDEHIEGIKQSSLELYAMCECFHTTSTTTTNSDGSTSTLTSTVVTYSEEIQIPIEEYKDLTNPLTIENINNILGDSSGRKRKYLKVSFIRNWYPTDQISQEAIKSYLDHLTIKNEHRDSSFRLELELRFVDKKFKEHLLFPIKSFSNNIDIIEKGPSYESELHDSPPFLFRYGYYILSLPLLMFLPYELYFNSKVYRSKFSFVKTIKVSTFCQENHNEIITIPQINQSDHYQTLNDCYNLNENQPSSSISTPTQIQQQQEKSIIIDKDYESQQQEKQEEKDPKEKSIYNIDK